MVLMKLLTSYSISTSVRGVGLILLRFAAVHIQCRAVDHWGREWNVFCLFMRSSTGYTDLQCVLELKSQNRRLMLLNSIVDGVLD